MSPLARGGRSQARMMMTHRARVLRPSEAEDAYGSPAHDEAPVVLHAALPCRAWSPTDAREVLDEDASAVFGAVRLAVPADSDITEGDTIAQVVDRAARVVFDGPLAITAVTPRSGHLAVMARVARGGRG